MAGGEKRRSFEYPTRPDERQATPARSGDAAPANGRRGRRRGESHRRRDEILDAAARVFHEKGYAAASTKDIADAVGLLKGSLYYYFEAKEDFLFAIVKETYDGALAALEDVRAMEGNAVEKLAAVIGTHLAYYTANLPRASVFFREFRSLSEDRQALIIQKDDAYLEFLRELLAQGQREGSVAAVLDVHVVSFAIGGMLASMYHMLDSMEQLYGQAGQRTAETIAREYVTLMITGVITEEAAGRAGGLEELRGHIRRRATRPAGEGAPAEPSTAG